MIVQVQKQTGHEPDTWEDVKIPTDCEDKGVEYLAEKYRILQQAGNHRVFMSDGAIHGIRAYPVTAWQVSIDGVVFDG